MVGTTTGNGTVDHRRQEVQQAVKNACDQLNSDGVTPRDYVEQLAWLFFLKAFDEIEQRREDEGAFEEKPYTHLLKDEFRWSEWSKKTDRPDEMLEFVSGRLWKHLQNLEGEGAAERIKRIFSSVKNHSRRGASFARVVQQINRLHFSDDTDVIVLSEIYEDLLKRVAGDSAGYAGEFYTQRHLIRAMVHVVRPKMGERIYDRTNGSPNLVGRCAVFEKQEQPFGFASYLIRVRVDQEQVNSRFLQYFLSSTQGRDQIAERRRTSAGQFNINTANLKTITFPCPPVYEQQTLVERMNEIRNASLTILEEQRSNAVNEAAIKDAILRKAFVGEL
ncbi:type I restriction-modification system subunit M N-terminal domain-containing protein [Nostoc sp.]|uniref:type I restriction-modification system subunit M N-terminal domain-containing protein n=1 Tax=Nostoc sp. TaxID=1180 RepID=UPI002FF57305